MSRNVKLEHRHIRRISSALQNGCFINRAAEQIGIARSTYYRWMEIGYVLRDQLLELWDSLPDVNSDSSEAFEEEEYEQWLIGGECLEINHLRSVGKHHKDWLCVVFVYAVERARAIAISRALEGISRASETDWRAAAWLLERGVYDPFSEQPDRWKDCKKN